MEQHYVYSILQLRRKQNFLNRTLKGYLIFYNETTKNKTSGQTISVVFSDLSPNLKYQVIPSPSMSCRSTGSAPTTMPARS